MTNTEAIAIIQDEAYFLYEDDSPRNREAFDKAVKALGFMDVLEKAYKCPSMLLDKSEKLDEIMLAYQKIR